MNSELFLELIADGKDIQVEGQHDEEGVFLINKQLVCSVRIVGKSISFFMNDKEELRFKFTNKEAVNKIKNQIESYYQTVIC